MESTRAKNFAKFMGSPYGRGLRIVAGLILIGIGAFLFTKVNWILVIIGLIPLSAGVFDFCLIAPLLGYSLSGKKTRMQVNTPENNTGK